MNCMKCGRETKEDAVFCEDCLDHMNRHPVPPNTLVYVPTEKDICGPIPGMVISTKAKYVDLQALKSHLVVVGTVSALDEYTLQSTSVTNGEYIINMFNTLCERRDVISIAPKVIGSTELNINAGQAYILLFIFVILLPLIVLITGLVIWFKRRNK